jgi:phenylpropionate dioxygenase-like ring-hydroxylating dioxygenase large terminal subunit
MIQDSSLPQENLGLPGYYYYDAHIYATEMQVIWRNTWQFVGRESELANVGDYITCLIGDQPIFVMRTSEGKLEAMHNVCPHRSARLLEERGNCNFIRCPYHAWTFNLAGKLQGVPQSHLFPKLDKSTVCLSKARVDVACGFIFVHPQPAGESLNDYLAGFPEYLQQYNQPWEEMVEVARWSYREPINWKFVVENYVEDYHFSTLHSESLAFFDFPGIRTIPIGRHCQVHVPFSEQEESDSQAISYQGYIFPNLMVNTDKNFISVFRVFPISPICTDVDVFIYQTPAQKSVSPVSTDTTKSGFDRVMEEDFAVCRLLQANVHSIAYGVSTLAEIRELGIAHFYKVLSSYLQNTYGDRKDENQRNDTY